jgi:photosystem II stability/assembly factor-like uncharacterized protein
MQRNTPTFFLTRFALVLLMAIMVIPAIAKDKKKKEDEKAEDKKEASAIYTGLKWRAIGPAMTSGRIADFAVNPENNAHWFVAVASGHVWKTENNGTTFIPVFDKEGAYSIGVVTMDPNNPNVIWVGTGENNHQRALGYGDGVYKSEDGGKSWENMGLKESRQIGGIVIDPRNSDIVFVAAEGSAWGPGGDRGLYRSEDGGKRWEKVIDISENTGINNVVMDPVDPDIMYATSEQRRRHVYTKIGGGPESAVYRSSDGGKTWEKSMKGLPSVDIGGMGIDVSPADHNVVYLIMEAANGKGGFFRSTDRGASWEKMSDHHASGQYYNEIYADPVDVDKVYSMETYSKVTLDGGKTWNSLGNDNRHVDDHALWIDPEQTTHVLIGGDGGVYETFDGGKTWQFKTNLPVTQFYRVNVDNEFPFYNVFGGTQDNNTLMGPSQNFSDAGVTSEEWKAIRGGDGFWVGLNEAEPNIVYTESQYGNVYRYDKASGESVNIKPRPRKGEETYKWNWNAPLVVSKHSPTRIYMMANKLFRSEDRGNTWQVISGDLTSGMDRNSWPVMGHYWSYDAVVKDVSTSLFGTGVSFCESPLDEQLLYAGTDDGVLSITEDGGDTWRQVKQFEGVPEYTYISDIMADKYDRNTVYVSFDNRKRDDFKPYLMKSTDAGRSWEPVATNLPENGTVHTLEQDGEVRSLLFAGTEFGAFFSLNSGKEWIELTSGIPSAIPVRDMVIQERENDLVLATFGRGFYILDDYTPLREMALNPDIKEEKAYVFSIPESKMYILTGGKYGQGTNFFKADNPEFGAVITYYLKEVPNTLREERHEREKKLFEEKQPIPQPSREQLLEEEREIDPYLVFTVYDATGTPVRRITRKPSKGIDRVTWDLRLYYPYPVRISNGAFSPTAESRGGILCMPGTYSVSLDLVSRSGIERLVEPVEFTAELLNRATLPADDRQAVMDYQAEVTELSRVFLGMDRKVDEEAEKIEHILQTALQTPGVPMEVVSEAKDLRRDISSIRYAIDGPSAIASWEELPPMDMPLGRRLNVAVRTHWNNTSGVTSTAKDQLSILKEEFPPLLKRLEQVVSSREALEQALEDAGAPWTPGRMPVL